MKHDHGTRPNDRFNQEVNGELKRVLKQPSNLLYIAFILLSSLYLLVQGFRILANNDILLGLGALASALFITIYFIWEIRQEKLSEAILMVKIRNRLVQHEMSSTENLNNDLDSIFKASKHDALEKINGQTGVIVILTLVSIPILFITLSWKIALSVACVAYIFSRFKAKQIIAKALVTDVDVIVEDVIASTNVNCISNASVSTVPTQEELIDICKRRHWNNFYVLDQIPAKKLENASKHYPVPGGGTIIAIIDTTAYGSADCGLAVGEHGISWVNSYLTRVDDSIVHQLSWYELKSLIIGKSSSEIKIGMERFEISDVSSNIDHAVALLKEIQQAIREEPKSGASTVESTNSATDESTNFAHSKNNYSNKHIHSSISPNTSKATQAERLDINEASYNELLGLPGIGAVEGKRIIKHREQNHRFSSIEEAIMFLQLKPYHAKQWEKSVFVSPADESSSTHVSIEESGPTVGGRTID